MSVSDQALTEQQRALARQLKADVAPIIEKDASLKLFCNEHTYVRYLRARQWNLQKATKMLRATLQWRLEFKPHLIRFDDVKEEAVTGKNQIYPYADKRGRPLLIMRPRFENTKTSDRQIKFLIYLLERASKDADERGVHKMTWLLDFEGYSTRNAPPLKVSMMVNQILQDHYPERLGAAVCFHAPYLFSLTWKAVRPFVDVATQNKIFFADKGAEGDKLMHELFYMEHMEKCLGGAVPDYIFDMAKFEQASRMFDQSMNELLTNQAQAMRGSSPAGPLADSSSDLQVQVAGGKLEKMTLSPTTTTSTAAHPHGPTGTPTTVTTSNGQQVTYVKQPVQAHVVNGSSPVTYVQASPGLAGSPAGHVTRVSPTGGTQVVRTSPTTHYARTQ